MRRARLGPGVRHHRLPHPARHARTYTRREGPVPARRPVAAKRGRSRLRGWSGTALLVLSLTECLAAFLRLRLRGTPDARGRAAWLHRCCKMVLRRLAIVVSVEGDPPIGGLVVSNHLSYLDILVYGATLPCVFVAKTEVRSWPMLGLLAALGGTVFIDRGSRTSAAKSAARIEELLAAGIVVLVFPEGTSSDGSEVLPFYPSLFEPAVQTAAPVAAAAIGYSAAPLAEEKDLCYYGDIRFGPHLVQTLQLPRIAATLRFGAAGQTFANRKQAAAAAHLDVVGLRKVLQERRVEASENI